MNGSPRNAIHWTGGLVIAAGPRDYEVAMGTDAGPARGCNEDGVAADAARGVVVVVDGSGGKPDGIVAERVLAAVIGALPEVAPADRTTAMLKAAVLVGDRAIAQPGDPPVEALDLQGSGATIAVAWMGAGGAAIAHVGDVRAYRVRGTTPERLTRDHTLWQMLLDAGKVRPEDEAGFAQRTVITHSLGMGPEPDVRTRVVALMPNDRLILCSDGVHHLFADADLARMATGAPGATVDAVLAAVARGKSGDNGSIAVIAVRAVGN